MSSPTGPTEARLLELLAEAEEVGPQLQAEVAELRDALVTQTERAVQATGLLAQSQSVMDQTVSQGDAERQRLEHELAAERQRGAAERQRLLAEHEAAAGRLFSELDETRTLGLQGEQSLKAAVARQLGEAQQALTSQQYQLVAKDAERAAVVAMQQKDQEIAAEVKEPAIRSRYVSFNFVCLRQFKRTHSRGCFQAAAERLTALVRELAAAQARRFNTLCWCTGRSEAD